MAETTTYESASGPAPDGHATSPVTIAIAWIVVILPAAWGITQTIKQSTQLFKNPPAAVTPTTTTTTR